MNRTILPKVKREYFFYLLVLTGFFLLLEISFFVQCNQAYLYDAPEILNSLDIPGTIIWYIGLFLLIQLSLHLVYCILVWVSAIAIIEILNIAKKYELMILVSVWVLGIMVVLLGNQFIYPNSYYAQLITSLLPQFIAQILLVILLIVLSIAGLLTVIFWVTKLKSFWIITSVLIANVVIWHLLQQNKTVIDNGTASKPNIILIGIDSLRPDFLRFFGGQGNTTFLDHFLTKAIIFNEAVTPLARTFPSWVSILTGLYPLHSGVRSNLASIQTLTPQENLGFILQKQGYETIFATDETRFSNIDQHLGFHQIISPPIGLNDFLLGSFNDFPFSNLLVNTWIGRYLFPFSYANRAVFVTYQPDTFLKMIANKLSLSRSKPLFFATHFCLPHFPYLWDDFTGKNVSIAGRYEASIERFDQQLAGFFRLLKIYGLLDHALVLVFSDHGEALELKGDRITEQDFFVGSVKPPRFYPPSLDQEQVNQSAGHGTDVLGLPQYHALLAVRGYGLKKKFTPRQINGVVSLLDIKSTILDLLNLSPAFKTNDGISLLPFIMGANKQIPPRHIFLESDFTPEAMNTLFPQINKILLEGVGLFKVDRQTLRLSVKNDMALLIVRSKQYADIYDHWMLALYPQANGTYFPILIDLKTGFWTCKFDTPFAQTSPYRAMLSALRSFYRREIGLITA